MAPPQLLHGDSAERLQEIEDNTLDAAVSDPPYGWDFMGQRFDTFTNRESFIEQMEKVFRETYRVLKPGVHGLFFAGPRTAHWTATALENSGFEVRNKVYWVYGQGFPKSRNIGKDVDKLRGNERQVVGTHRSGIGKAFGEGQWKSGTDVVVDTVGSSEWEGWGTALKPAAEEIIMVRKPVEEKLSVARNVLKYGTGAINVDACRIGTEKVQINHQPRWSGFGAKQKAGYTRKRSTGRYPANFLLSHLPDCEETCAPGCPEPELEKQRPGASGFFYTPKPTKREKDAGCEHLGGNVHTTVKPTKLLRYLITLITPPGGLVLDPFAGSCSTGIAAVETGRDFLGIERESQYHVIGQARLNHAQQQEQNTLFD